VRDARVRHDDVDAAERHAGVRERGAHRRLVGHVHAHGAARARTRGLRDPLARALEALGVDVRQHDVRAGAHQLGKVAALELAGAGIRVNMINADAVFGDASRPSGLWQEVGPARARSRGLDPSELQEFYRQRNLLKALVMPEHVGNVVVFLASNQTPTTGATFPVDGGSTHRGNASGSPPSTGRTAPVVGVRAIAKNATASPTWRGVTVTLSMLRCR